MLASNNDDQQLGLFKQSELKSGIIILHVIGVIYFGGIVYILNTKYMYAIIEELVFIVSKQNSDQIMSPIIYCFMNSVIFIMVILISIFNNKSNFGISCVIGTDMTNQLLIFGLIVKNYYYQDQYLDSWTYLRDLVYYLIGCGFLSFTMITETITWYYSLILIIYYIAFYIIQLQNKKIKEKILTLFGQQNEQDNFNNEEHFVYQKRRSSITNLKEFNKQDNHILTNKLKQIENNLKHKADDGVNVQALIQLQKVVVKVIYSIRAQIKHEKQQRSDYYARLFMKDKKKKNNGFQQSGSNETVNKNINLNQNNNQQINDGLLDFNKNYDQDSDNNQENQQYSDNNISQNNNDNQINLDNVQEIQNNYYQDESDEEQFTLQYPKKKKCLQIMYFLYFPVYLLLSIFPSSKKINDKKKLVIVLILNLALFLGISYCIVDWCNVIAQVSGIKPETLGVTLGNIVFSLSFVNYNIKIAENDKEIDFMQSFLQLAIYKISICIGLCYLIATFYYSDLKLIGYKGNNIHRLGFICIGFIVSLIITIIAISYKKFVLDKKLSHLYLILWFILMVTSIAVIQS